MLYHVLGCILGSVGPGYDVLTLEIEDMALSRNLGIRLAHRLSVISQTNGTLSLIAVKTSEMSRLHVSLQIRDSVYWGDTSRPVL
jgi:hypothetical protein